ncbi:hypothetical protein FHG87_014436 [Trinorchestia longiramus]|nr:hypothetical protein FHG87_014436 [Trinorchestia longiramus]
MISPILASPAWSTGERICLRAERPRAGAQALAEEQAVLAAERQRLSELRAQLEDTEGQRDAALREIRRLQGEMAGLQKDLDQCRTQRDAFKLRTQEYCATLEKLGEALATKATEECALRQQYLNLNDTVEILKTHSQSLEGDVVIRDQKLGHMETLVGESKRERDQLLQQVAEAAEQVAEFDARCKALEEAKFESDKELISSRELAQRLDSKRAELEGELNRTEDALDKVSLFLFV